MIRYIISNAKFNFDKILIILSVLICFSSAPYLTHYLFGNHYVFFSGISSIVLFAGVCGFNKIKVDNWFNVWVLFALSFFVYSILVLFRDGSFFDVRKFIGISVKILFLLSSLILIRKQYNYYLFIFFKVSIFIVLLSVLLFFLLLLGFDFTPIIFIKLDGREHMFYWIGATNVYFNFANAVIIRIAGFSDEPGAFALSLSYLLVLNEFTYKSNKVRILFMIGGFLSFSLAFIITSSLFFIFWIKRKIIRPKSKYTLLFIFSILVFSISPISFLDGVKEGINHLIFERFEPSSDGVIKGDNRSHAIPTQIKAFENHPVLGVGSNPENISRYMLGQPSFFSYLTLHGLFGFFFFYIPFYFLAYRYRKKSEILLLFVLFLNYTQRPSIEEMFAMICLTFIYYSNYFEKSKNKYNYCII